MGKKAVLSDLVRVVTSRPSSYHGNLVIGGRICKCALGRSGLRLRKREGDGATPIGLWPMQYVMFRGDRVRRPRTGLPVFTINANDGWCDDPASRQYNRPVDFPFGYGAEHLWREDGLYDIVVVLGHNDDPPVAGRGSAVFFHIAAPGYSATEGCVAVRLRDMYTILELCGPTTRMQIG